MRRRFHCGYIEKLTKPWEFPDLTGTNHEFRIVDLTQGMETVSDRDIRNLHILVLDDDADDREGMKRCLRQLGVTRVREADDPVSALEFMQSRRVDVLITERYLPFVRFLRTSRKSPASSVPIVMVSDRGRKADIHEAQDAGIDEFVRQASGRRNAARTPPRSGPALPAVRRIGSLHGSRPSPRIGKDR